VNETRQLASVLFASDWATPAAILVALIDDPALEVLPSDRCHVRTLHACGCLSGGVATPLGRRVGLVLCNKHGMRAWVP